MHFVDIDKKHIKSNSILTPDGYYRYKLGNSVEITSVKKHHMNNLVASNLSHNSKEDKLMVRYTPTSEIYFSHNFVESDIDKNLASCYIDSKSCCVYVGTPEEFELKSGVLTFSGFLSLNNLVEEDKLILGNAKVVETIKKRVRILAIGLRGDNLLALYYIPNVRGMAIGMKGREDVGRSSSSLKIKDCTSYSKFTVNDWFTNTKIKEI